MTRAPFFFVLFLVVFLSSRAEGLSGYVNPLIGTHGPGNTYPGAQVPHGMVQLSPDNGTGGWDRIAGYFYPDSTISGFSHTHLSGTGAGDLYDVSFMPYRGIPRVAPGLLGLHSRFSHEREEARAGFYSVVLDDYDVLVELTASERAGFQRYTPLSPAPGDTLHVVLNLQKALNWDATSEAQIRLDVPREISGFRRSKGWVPDQKVWFCTVFSRPYVKAEVDTGIANLSFIVPQGESLTVATAISGTDREGAATNLKTEFTDFDSARRNAQGKWDAALSALQLPLVEVTPLQATVFYTALYHALLCPTLWSDADGRYQGPDGQTHQLPEGQEAFSTFSLWDTFRGAHPLYNLVEPARAAQMVRSLADFTLQAGQLPVWPLWGQETGMMLGYHSAPITAQAAFLGIFPAKEALDACVKSARKGDYPGLQDYIKLGYVPCDSVNWSLSRTLEYSLDDAAIAALAHIAGDTAAMAEFEKRAQNYRNLWDPNTGFFRPRLASGGWKEPFDPRAYTQDIAESNAWQYLWTPALHDPEGLIQLLGGREAAQEKLDLFFSLTDSAGTALPIFSTGMVGQYAHGNEPSHHAALLYSLLGEKDKAHLRLKQIFENQYTDRPDGLCGNDDCGQMSAWYVLSAMGLYPLCPFRPLEQTAEPMIPHIKINPMP